jgi:hypothetical protein
VERRIPWYWLGFLALLLASPASTFLASHKDGSTEESHATPKVALSITPAFGFPPLSIQLVAVLSGVDAHDPNFCHPGVTWIRVDPGSQQDTGTKVTEAPRCLHGEDEVSVATTFSKSFELYTPGAYLYRVVLAGKDGTQVRSNYVKVQVMRVP